MRTASFTSGKTQFALFSVGLRTRMVGYVKVDALLDLCSSTYLKNSRTPFQLLPCWANLPSNVLQASRPNRCVAGRYNLPYVGLPRSRHTQSCLVDQDALNLRRRSSSVISLLLLGEHGKERSSVGWGWRESKEYNAFLTMCRTNPQNTEQ